MPPMIILPLVGLRGDVISLIFLSGELASLILSSLILVRRFFIVYKLLNTKYYLRERL